jgi:hypothetical protein
MLLKESYETRAITAEGLPTTKKIEIGQYKRLPNHVLTVTGEIFRFATPEDTPAKMEDLIKWYREWEINPHVNPIQLASQFHHKFVQIHPFDDGNGRTARILMNFILMKFDFPPVIIKTADKANYFSALRLADAGLIDSFVDYVAKNLVSSIDLMIRGAKGLSIEEPDDLDKELELLSRRLNNADSGVEKADKVIDALFQTSLVPLFTKFIDDNKKFERFYHKVRFSLIAGHTIIDPVQNLTQALNEITIGGIDQIHFRCHFEQFKDPSLGDFTYVADITVAFNPNSYVVSYGTGKALAREYTQPLRSADIKDVVGEIMNDHKNVIAESLKTR